MILHQNNEGSTPLHYACRYGQSDYVIQMLVLEYPLALIQPTHDERSLPIEIAKKSKARLETLLFLQTQASYIRFDIFEYLLKNDKLLIPAKKNRFFVSI